MNDYWLREKVYGDRAQRERTWRRILFDKHAVRFPVPGRLKAAGTPDFRLKVNRTWLDEVECEEARISRERNEVFRQHLRGHG